MKKLPFKPTALRRAAPATQTETPTEDKGKDIEGLQTKEDDGLGLFKRSSEMKSLLAADRDREFRKIQKREEEQKRKHKEEEAERRKSSPDEPAKTVRDDKDDDPFLRSLATPPPSKRSKLDTPSSIHTRSGKSTRSSHHNVEDSPIAAPQLDAASSSHIPASSSDSVAIVVDDSDDDSDVVPVTKPAPPRSPTPDFTLADDDDDDAMAEYVRKAKLAKEEAAAARLASLPIHAADGGDMFSSPAPSRAKADAVEIILTSVIPDTRSSGAKVPFDKPLRIVRDTWVAQQRKYGVTLPPGTVDDEIVLTWRRNKVYMSSSLQSLGIRSLGGGRVAVAGGNSEGLNDARTRVHMEVWTPELFSQMEREEEARRRRVDEEAEQEGGDDEEQEVEAEVKLRIILKPRDLEPFKLVVRPETTVQDLVRAFRKARDVADETDVGLWFDGERLDEQSTIEDADIDDMDALEVHIK